ncbi:MAG: DUF2304 domain-containing protein, partial [Acidimicrobiia bacterium]
RHLSRRRPLRPGHARDHRRQAGATYPMSLLAQILVVVIALGALILVVALVRARRLRERYAVIWLLVAVGMTAQVIARPLLDRLSVALWIQSGTSTLLLIATLAILGILLQLSVSLSALEDKVQDIAEAVALSDPVSSVDEAEDG